MLYAFQQMYHNCYPAGGLSFSMLFPLLNVDNTPEASCESLSLKHKYRDFKGFSAGSCIRSHFSCDEKRLIGGVSVSPPYFLLVLVWQRQASLCTNRKTHAVAIPFNRQSWWKWLSANMTERCFDQNPSTFVERVFSFSMLSVLFSLDFWHSWLVLLIYMTLWVLLFLDRNNSASANKCAPVLRFDPLHADRLVWEEHSGVRPCSQFCYLWRKCFWEVGVICI